MKFQSKRIPRPTHAQSKSAHGRPLAFPDEIWDDFEPQQQELYRNAQTILDAISEAQSFTKLAGPPEKGGFGLTDMTGLSGEKVLDALSVLSEMGLINVHQEREAQSDSKISWSDWFEEAENEQQLEELDAALLSEGLLREGFTDGAFNSDTLAADERESEATDSLLSGVLKVELLAVPEEHIKIVGPGDTLRWVMVARPIKPPTFDHSELN